MSVKRPPNTAGPIWRQRRLEKGAGASAGPDPASPDLADCCCAGTARAPNDPTMTATPSNVRVDETADLCMAGSPTNRDWETSARQGAAWGRRDSVVEYRNAYAAVSMGRAAGAAARLGGYSGMRRVTQS